MKFDLRKPFDSNCKHRDTTFSMIVNFNDSDVQINGISVIAVLTDKWWVVADHCMNDSKFSDVGPFDTVEEALVYIRLAQT